MISNFKNLQLVLRGRESNQLSVDAVLSHWFNSVFSLSSELIMSKYYLQTFPISDVAGLMSLHLGWF